MRLLFLCQSIHAMSRIERVIEYGTTLHRNLKQRYLDLSFEGKVSPARCALHTSPG